MSRILVAVAVVFVGAVGGTRDLRPVVRVPAADSLALERTLCFGTCPAYRLVVSRTRIRFESRNPGDSTRGTDSIAPSMLDSLLADADRAGFFTLPPRTDRDKELCPGSATDHPTETVIIYQADTIRSVLNYTGCWVRTMGQHPRLAQFHAFTQTIDRVTQSSRWVKPATRRR